MKKKLTVTDRIITKITGWIAGITIIALSVWAVLTLWSYHKYEQTNDAQVQEYINPVISRAGGFIVAVKFDENQPVKKGDTLLIVDNREYTLQVAQTKASILKAEAQIKVLESKVRTTKKDAGSAKAQIKASAAKVWKQQLDFDRYSRLYKEESATKQQLEHVQATLDVNNSDYQAAQENYGAATSKTDDILVEKTVLRAEITRLKAVLERNRLDVDYTIIKASYDGRMGRRSVEVGQMINAGEVLAYIVNNETDKWVVANYKETQIANMHIGDTVKFVADAFPDEEFKGTIISLSPATGSSFSLLPPDNSTGNYVKIVQRVPVRIRVNTEKKHLGLLKVGMNVNVYVPKNQRNHG